MSKALSIDENEASPRPPAAEQRWRRELRRQQIAMLVRQAPLLALVNLVNGALVAFVLWEQAARLPLALWFAGVVVLALYPLRAWWSSRRHPAPGSGSQRSIRRAAVLGGLDSDHLRPYPPRCCARPPRPSAGD